MQDHCLDVKKRRNKKQKEIKKKKYLNLTKFIFKKIKINKRKLLRLSVFKPCFIALVFVQGMIILLVIAGSLLRLSVFPSLDVNNVALAKWPG